MYLTSSLTWCTFLIYAICIYIYMYIVDSKCSLDLLHHVASLINPRPKRFAWSGIAENKPQWVRIGCPTEVFSIHPTHPNVRGQKKGRGMSCGIPCLECWRPSNNSQKLQWCGAEDATLTCGLLVEHCADWRLDVACHVASCCDPGDGNRDGIGRCEKNMYTVYRVSFISFYVLILVLVCSDVLAETYWKCSKASCRRLSRVLLHTFANIRAPVYTSINSCVFIIHYPVQCQRSLLLFNLGFHWRPTPNASRHRMERLVISTFCTFKHHH